MKMKTLRLTELSKKELSKRQMKKVRAGEEDKWCMEKCGTISPDINYEGNRWKEYFYD